MFTKSEISAVLTVLITSYSVLGSSININDIPDPTTGYSFYFTVTLNPEMSSATIGGYLDVSISGPNIQNISCENKYDFPEAPVYAPGSTIHTASGLTITSRNWLASGHTTYFDGYYNYSMRIKVTLSSSNPVCGIYTILYRGTLGQQNVSGFTATQRIPTSGTLDQQGWACKTESHGNDAPLPDLIISSFTVNNGQAITAVQPIILKAIAAEINGYTAGSTNVYFYIDGSKVYGTPISLFANGSITVSTTITAPVAGSHTFKVTVDPTDLILESSESNSISKTITVLWPLPSIVSFSTDVHQIYLGDLCRLSWSTNNASSATINGSSVQTSGTLVPYSPSSTTTYTLVASNQDGKTTTQFLVVTVVPRPQPVVTSITASYTGTTVKIVWSGNSSTSGYEIWDDQISPISTMQTSYSFTSTWGSSGVFHVIPIASDGTRGVEKTIVWSIPYDSFKMDVANTASIPYDQLTTFSTGYLRDDGQILINGTIYPLDDSFSETWLPAHGVTATDNVIMAINYTDKRSEGFFVEFQKSALNVQYGNISLEGNAYSVSSVAGTVVWLLAGSCLNYAGCVLGSTDQTYLDPESGQFVTYRDAYCQTSATWQNAGWCALDIATFIIIPLKAGKIGKVAVAAKFSDGVKEAKVIATVSKAPFYKALSTMTLKIVPVLDRLDPDVAKIFLAPKEGRIESKYADNLIGSLVSSQDVAYKAEVNSHLILITDERQVFKPFIASGQISAMNVKVYGEIADPAITATSDIVTNGKTFFKKSTLSLTNSAGKSPVIEIDHMVYKIESDGSTTILGNFVTTSTVTKDIETAHNLGQAKTFMDIAPTVFGSGNKYKAVGWSGMDKADVVIKGLPKKMAVDSIIATVQDCMSQIPTTDAIIPPANIRKVIITAKYYGLNGRYIDTNIKSHGVYIKVCGSVLQKNMFVTR